MKMVKYIAAVAAVLSFSAAAASGAVYRDRNNECYLWLCLPGAFGSAQCRSAVHKAFIDRISVLRCHKGSCVQVYRNLPDFSHCIDANPAGVEDATEEEMGAAVYDMTHAEYFKITIPVHNICTAWSGGTDSADGHCTAVRSLPERTYYTKDSTRVNYENIEVGWHAYQEFPAPMWTITEVYADGKLYGGDWEEKIQ